VTTCIRLANAADGAALAAIYRPAVVEHATSFELDPPDAAEMARRVAEIAGRLPWLVCEREGSVIGYAYAAPHRTRPAYQWSVDVSVYVRADAHRAGVGRALYTSILAVLALQGFRNVYAGITLPNPASEGLHCRLGFTPVGVYRGVGYKHGRWHDVAWFERPLAPRTPEPPVPRTLAELMADGEGEALAAALAAGAPYPHLGGTAPVPP